MSRKISRRRVAALLGIPASLVLTRAVWAGSTYTWTGSALDTQWTSSGNWTGGAAAFPVSGDTALFNGVAADGSNIVNLGGGTQGLFSLTFNTGAAAYNVGILNSGDAFNFDAGGNISLNAVTNAQTINAVVNTAAATGTVFTIMDAAPTTLTMAGNLNLNGTTVMSGSTGSTLTISGNIAGTGAVQVNNLSQTSGTVTTNYMLGTLNLTGHNTYSGGTTLSVGATVIPITFTPTDQTYGVFGTGKITFNNSNNTHIRPVGSQTIYNSIMINGGGIGMEATGAASISDLTFAGPIAFNTAGRFFSNGFTNSSTTNFGGNLILGLAGTNASTITMPVNNGTAATAVSFAAISGPIIINDVIQNSAGTSATTISLNPQAGDSNTISIFGLSTYSGSTTIGGANFTGMGAIGVGVSTISSGTNVTAGPFGTGTLIVMNATTPPNFMPLGGDRTIANVLAMNTGFWASNAPSSLDPTGAHNLTFTGPISLVSADRTLTNNMAAGVDLTLGSATAASTFTLGVGTGRMITIQSQATSGGGVTIINDVIQDASSGAGTVRLQTGTTFLNANNTFSGGLSFVGGTGVISSDLNMGSATGTVSLSSGTLEDTGTFTTARTFNLAGTSGVIDVASGQTMTLTGAVTGSGNLNKGTSSGTLQLTLPVGGALSGAVNANGGLLVIGANSSFTNTPNGPVVTGGGLTSSISVGALNIAGGAKVAVNPSLPGTGVTNSVGSLSIGNGGSLDIGNHTVIVQNAADETVIGGYLSNGYAGGFWNGTSPSGGAITSVVAFNDNSGATSIGYGNSADFTFGGSTSPYAVGGPKALSGNQVVVAPALAGDLLLSGTVGPNELALMLGSFGTTGNDWAFGNIDYDAAGLVGPNDLSLLLSNFGHSSAGFVGAKTSAKSLTSTAKPSLVASASDVAPPPADGIELIVNFQTGDVQMEGNNATAGTSIVLTSAANGLVGGTTFTPAFSALFNTSASNTNGLIDEFNTFTNGSAVNGLVDLGDVYNTTQNSGDIQFQFSEKGINRGGLQTGSVTYVGVPEPTTLSLLAVASAGLLSRRRRRTDAHL